MCNWSLDDPPTARWLSVIVAASREVQRIEWQRWLSDKQMFTFWHPLGQLRAPWLGCLVMWEAEEPDEICPGAGRRGEEAAPRRWAPLMHGRRSPRKGTGRGRPKSPKMYSDIHRTNYRVHHRIPISSCYFSGLNFPLWSPSQSLA